MFVGLNEFFYFEFSGVPQHTENLHQFCSRTRKKNKAPDWKKITAWYKQMSYDTVFFLLEDLRDLTGEQI